MLHHIILHVTSKLLIPLILIFALYVQFHGDFGPGGGFQAGVLFSAGFILYALVFGVQKARRVASYKLLRILLSTGVLIYGGTGVITLLRGGNFLDYDGLGTAPLEGQHLGILLIELGVGITVAAAMLTLFYAFSSRR